YANQDAPFEVLVKELEPERDTSRAPFFQVLFNVANIRTGAVELDGLSYEPLSLKRDASQFDMSINVGWEEIDSTLRLTYNTSLFRHETAERMLAHYLEILEAVTAEPERRLSELKLPSRRDRALFTGWNDATAKEFGASGVMQMFAQRATQHPDRIAVRSPTGSFTYAELLRYAQGITAELQHAGIGKGDRVAILMERSREMLGALLGILGSGAAYIPVDPAYPEARVRYVLEDSGARVVLTHRGLQNRVETDTRVIDLDGWTPRAHAPFAEVEPAQPAYVIYTSGSTGKPKGVEVTHGGVRNFLLSMQERPGITPDDVILAVTTISFDIAVLELYLPLITGARVVITSEDDALDGRRLVQLMEQEGVTLMQATPATWKLLIAGGWQGKPDLRVLCGGEPLPRPLADELLDRVAELWNMYGPTETTVWSTLDRVERGGDITVGRPIANTTCYVLGDDMQMKPVGVPGELWIGGAGVANGYVNRPDLTEKAFIDSPFREGERIYRTGDLVRWRHDGRLEHLGRLDNQVKVRGFRVELGEVEAALVAHPYVKDAVVAVRDDRLIGYIVPEPGTTVSPAELRRVVGDVLPPYMVPSVIMSLQALPLTPNGKVDRKALPEPVVAVAETHDVRTPQDPTAQAIARIWEELLEIDQVSLDDRFFEIGGHSLLAMEVVARIEEVTGVRPEPRSLFFMTLEELAATIGSNQEVVT
ncbi:MAG: amino acid adenylation domain-containing protein, partial [Candidatus Cloacimonetes bacterium]|nr:amino acid adenylation domain-containing protein [Candidatus Cloacimonadota bacterium]